MKGGIIQRGNSRYLPFGDPEHVPALSHLVFVHAVSCHRVPQAFDTARNLFLNIHTLYGPGELKQR